MRFWKMNGVPRDFIILNNCDETLPDTAFPQLARILCDPTRSLGADGLLVADKIQDRFHAALYDRDGSPCPMDESAARCVCRFARELSLCGRKLQADTPYGPIQGRQVDHRTYQICLEAEEGWVTGTTNLLARGEILDEDLPELYWLLRDHLCQ